jgi:PEP-CTERM motif
MDIGFGQDVTLAGDYNGDGSVDAADYVVWRKTQINGPQGYADWRANFGRTTGSGSALEAAGAVPEPTSVVLLLVGLASLYGRCRRT